MQRVFFISSLVFAVAFAQSPNCKPTEGVDFTNVPKGSCPNIIQYLNGDPGSPYAFDFNWCNTAASSSCAPSYVVQGGGGVCDRPFTGWTSGMSWNAQYQQVSYTVNDGAGTTATVTVTCDPNGADNTITCPSQYQVVGPNPSYQYTISLTSKCACPGGCSGGGGGDVASGLTGGGIFLILFFVGGALYAGIGFAYGFKMLGLTGVEAFPNIAFWRDFPALLKEGCGFFVAKVKGLSGGGGGGGGYATVA